MCKALNNGHDNYYIILSRFKNIYIITVIMRLYDGNTPASPSSLLLCIVTQQPTDKQSKAAPFLPAVILHFLRSVLFLLFLFDPPR